jgi:dolichyl-phosphate-mannose-protein mannosyltransferase
LSLGGHAEALPPRERRLAVMLALLAFAVRAAFLLFLARPYFGRENVHVDGDTSAWAAAFVNLLEHGVFTTNPDSPYGPFGRMPAYSFVIGIFYLLTGRRLDAAYPLLAWVQIAIDACATYLMAATAARAYRSPRTGLVAGLLYAGYPFVVVWTPVAYSESLGIATMIAAIYCFVRWERSPVTVACGALLGVSALFRPQVLVLAGVVAMWLVLRGNLRRLLALMVGLVITYGAWPLRNFVNYGRVVLTQDLRAFPNWSPDVIAFMQYMYSVKAEWEPQFSQLVTNRPVDLPPAAYAITGDGAKLERAVVLARTCASGFTYWRASVRPPLAGPNCNDEVAGLFDELRAAQYRHNRWNAYVRVPLQNLRKAVFKAQLTEGSGIRRLAALLFVFRTLLLAAGIAGAVVLIRSGVDATGLTAIAVGYFVVWYLLLCAGTLPQLRNVEMRYLLPADVLMLFPVAGFFAVREARSPPR